MEKKKIINYPSTIKKMFLTDKELCEPFIEDGDTRLANLLEGTAFPEGTRFQICDVMDCDSTNIELNFKGLIFNILLPSGAIFSGAAIRKKGDEFDEILPPFIAANRAIKVYKNNPQKTNIEIIFVNGVPSLLKTTKGDQ